MDEYKPPQNLQEKYPESYFSHRQLNDPKRIKQFQLEGDFIRKYLPQGKILDVGCSTGEFLTSINWQGEKYGMDISEFAKTEAIKKGFSFDKNLFTEKDYFDGIIFRGTIQHLDEPFRFLKLANRSLKKGGYVFFLATPNIYSPLYLLKRKLPFTQEDMNFYLPDDKNLSWALKNLGFAVKEVKFPYWESPYRNFFSDHWRFLKNIFSCKFYPHAFWRSSMEVVAQKNSDI